MIADTACPNCGSLDRITRYDIEQCEDCGYPSPQTPQPEPVRTADPDGWWTVDRSVVEEVSRAAGTRTP